MYDNEIFVFYMVVLYLFDIILIKGLKRLIYDWFCFNLVKFRDINFVRNLNE